MSLSLPETRAISRIANILYPFLPGTPHPYGVKRLSFPAVAQDLGLGQFWTGGSKRPAISRLLELTLENRRPLFCALVIEIVRRGQEKHDVTREEIDALNEAILALRFKIPELHDPAFLNSLPQAQPPEATPSRTDTNFDELRTELMRIAELAPQPRGFAFEKVLNGLFASSNLAPKSGFRNTGEQIDGSFEHDGQPYLLEAKWLGGPVGASDLLAFQGKVEGKAAWTRGLFVSYSSFSPDGLEAFRTGRSTRIICVDGFDLWQVIDRHLDFGDVLARKARRASENNFAFASVRDLFPEGK